MTVENDLMDHADQIKALFSDSTVRVTIVVRGDSMPDDKDIILSDDNFDAVIGAIMRRDGGSLS